MNSELDAVLNAEGVQRSSYQVNQCLKTMLMFDKQQSAIKGSNIIKIIGRELEKQK